MGQLLADREENKVTTKALVRVQQSPLSREAQIFFRLSSGDMAGLCGSGKWEQLQVPCEGTGEAPSALRGLPAASLQRQG